MLGNSFAKPRGNLYLTAPFTKRTLLFAFRTRKLCFFIIKLKHTLSPEILNMPVEVNWYKLNSQHLRLSIFICSTTLGCNQCSSSIIVVKARSANLDVCRSAGPEAVEAQCQRLEVRSKDGGRLLFTADEEEVTMTTKKFTVTGECAVLGICKRLKHFLGSFWTDFSHVKGDRRLRYLVQLNVERWLNTKDAVGSCSPFIL